MSIDYNNDKKPDKSDKRSENIFEIMDGIIDQLNNTKRLFIAMILTVMIIPPLVFIVAFELITSSSSDNPPSSVAPINHHKGEHSRGDGLFGDKPLFTITRNIPLIIGIIWLGVGIRQWIILSKWSRKYQRYKELQKKIDEELNNEEDSVNNN
ncbi:MAG: hypothetical protein ACTHKF_03470 [Candidatus Nitrosocosmicus sp.]